MDSIGTTEVQKVIEERASFMLNESQQRMDEEIGFASLTKEAVAEQVEVIIKGLEEAKSKGDLRSQRS